MMMMIIITINTIFPPPRYTATTYSDKGRLCNQANANPQSIFSHLRSSSLLHNSYTAIIKHLSIRSPSPPEYSADRPRHQDA
jgi:hypothetical protein